MNRTIRKSVPVLAAFVAGATITTMIGASSFNQPAKPGDTAMPPMDPAAMQRWAAVSTPGEQHAELVSSSGQWRVSSKFWMDPDGEPQTSEMRAVITPELGGRFIFERLSGEVMGEPFEGFGVFGYDNHKQMWTSVWVDNMNTATSYAEGQATDEGTIEMFGDMYDPITDATKEFKIVLWEDGPDRHNMSMFVKHEGEWAKGMEMEYHRVGRPQGDRPGNRPQGERPQGTRPR